MITLDSLPMLKPLTGQTSIDDTKIAPHLGANIKLIDTTDSTKFFVGIVASLTASVMNADTGVFTEAVLEGVDNTGKRRIIRLSIDNLENNEYAEYDKMLYTTTLSLGEDADIYIEADDSLVVHDRDVEVFDYDVVKVGAVMLAELPDGTPLNGVVSAVSPDGSNIRVTALQGARTNMVVLPLNVATHEDFQGVVVTGVFD